MEKLQDIELFITDENKDGVFAISLVDKPAIEEDFILLSKMEVNFKVVDKLKREVVGLALIPNKRILRAFNGKQFNVYFKEETIAKTQELYMRNCNNNNVTLGHESKTEGVTMIESWIVEDPKMDKINLYGIKAEKGSWAVKMKVYNDEVLTGIENGTYNGFSIEGKYDGLDQLEMNQVDETKAMIKEFLKQI